MIRMGKMARRSRARASFGWSINADARARSARATLEEKTGVNHGRIVMSDEGTTGLQDYRTTGRRDGGREGTEAVRYGIRLRSVSYAGRSAGWDGADGGKGVSQEWLTYCFVSANFAPGGPSGTRASRLHLCRSGIPARLGGKS